MLIDSKLIYSAPAYNISIIDPIILSTASGTEFYLLWLEEDPVRGWNRYVKFAVIDANGDFVEEPYIVYDYTDEDPEDIRKLAACTSQAGDIFAGWSEYFPEESAYRLVLGWFDHDSLGVEEDQLTRTADQSFSISASPSPFRESVIFTTNADPPPGQIAVYDISGRLVRSLIADPGDGSFFWDGTDSSGEELPPGTYIVRGASEGRLASVSVVKLWLPCISRRSIVGQDASHTDTTDGDSPTGKAAPGVTAGDQPPALSGRSGLRTRRKPMPGDSPSGG